MLLIAIIIGAFVAAYTVYAVVFIYKFKGTPKATMARILGVSSVAIVASFGSFLTKYFFESRPELELDASISFSVSAILGMIIFFWINRKKIG